MTHIIHKSDFQDFPGLEDRMWSKNWIIAKETNSYYLIDVWFLHPLEYDTKALLYWLYYGVWESYFNLMIKK